MLWLLPGGRTMGARSATSSPSATTSVPAHGCSLPAVLLALLQGMATPEIRQRLNQVGAAPGTLNAQAYGAYLDAQIQRWEKLLAEGKLDLK